MNLRNSETRILQPQTGTAMKHACNGGKCNSFDCYSPQRSI